MAPSHSSPRQTRSLDEAESDWDDDDLPLRPGQLSSSGWTLGICILAGMMTVGIVIGFAMGSSRPEPRVVSTTKPTEVAQAKPTISPTTPAPEQNPPTEPRKEPAPATQPKKVEPPKKTEPTKKVEEPKKPVEPPPMPTTKLVSFQKDISLIFQDKCIECHQPGLKKGGLDLKTLASIEKGGDGGKALVPGKPAESLIWKTIDDGEMPPAGKKPLSPAEKMLIKAWIESGGK
jgi:hypothetical protein